MVKGYPDPVAVLAGMEEVEPLTPMTPLAGVQWMTPIVLDTVEVKSRASKSIQQFDGYREEKRNKKTKCSLFTIMDPSKMKLSQQLKIENNCDGHQ